MKTIIFYEVDRASRFISRIKSDIENFGYYPVKNLKLMYTKEQVTFNDEGMGWIEMPKMKTKIRKDFNKRYGLPTISYEYRFEFKKPIKCE